MIPKTEGIIRERLWASIAKIVVYKFPELWQFIDDILGDRYGLQTEENCQAALMILK